MTNYAPDATSDKVRPGRECPCGEDRIPMMRKDRRSLDGHSPKCKACQARDSLAYHYANYDARMAYHDGRRAEKREYDRAYSLILVADGRASAKEAKRRALKESSACGTLSTEELAAIFRMREVSTCLCGAPAEHLDHIHPLSKGGCTTAHNLQWLCASCNLTKGALTMEDWVERRSRSAPLPYPPGGFNLGCTGSD